MDRAGKGWGLGHLHLLGGEAGCCTGPSGGGLWWGRRWGQHLWGHGGLLLLRNHRKLKGAPSVLYPSDKYSALCPLDVRRKIWLNSWNAFICEILTFCNIYSKADTHLKVIFNTALLQFFFFIIIFLHIFPLSKAMLQWVLQYNSCFLSQYTIWQHLFFPSVNIITSHMEPVIAYRHLRETRIIQSVPFVSLIYIHKCHFNSAGNM